jgi:hypothetical protein
VIFAKVDEDLVRLAGFPDFIANYTTDEKYMTPPAAAEHNFIFLAQVTPPVTHSA